METLPHELIVKIASYTDTGMDVLHMYSSSKLFRHADVIECAYIDFRFDDIALDNISHCVAKMSEKVAATEPFQHNKSYAFRIDAIRAHHTFIRLQRLQWGSDYTYKAYLYWGVRQLCTIEASRGHFGSTGIIHCECVMEKLPENAQVPLMYVLIGILFVAKMANLADGSFMIIRNGWLDNTPPTLAWFWRLIESNNIGKQKLYKDLALNIF